MAKKTKDNKDATTTTKKDGDQEVTDKGLKIVGSLEDVSRFEVGDYVQAHINHRDQVFLNYPHGERGIVVALSYEDDEYHYRLPIIQFTGDLRMFNPDHLVVVQRKDGSPGETEKLEAADEATKREKAKQEAEKK